MCGCGCVDAWMRGGFWTRGENGCGEGEGEMGHRTSSRLDCTAAGLRYCC